MSKLSGESFDQDNEPHLLEGVSSKNYKNVLKVSRKGCLELK